MSFKYAHVSFPNCTLRTHSQLDHHLLRKTRCNPPKFRENPITVIKCLITSFTARDRKAAAASRNFLKNGIGYYTEQSTKPQTLVCVIGDKGKVLLTLFSDK